MNCTSEQKTVAVIIPCRNEEKYIGRCLESLLENDYPKELTEIVVVDGMSDDHTRLIVHEYERRYPFIRMIDNPSIIKPVALNMGIMATDSDVVIRIDAHALYEKNYISKLVEGLFAYSADNIGGIRETDPGDSAMERAIAVGISHPFSVGNAFWRTGTSSIRKVDTVFCGCYRRDVFERIGLFNEALIRTQDKEFNARLSESRGVIILDPSVRCTYFPRRRLRDYLRWNFTGAYWLYYAKRFTKTRMTSWRNIIPLSFLLYTILFLLMFSMTPVWSLMVSIPIILYVILSLYFSVRIACQERRFYYVPLLFLIFPATHYSYGLGSLCGFIKARKGSLL